MTTNTPHHKASSPTKQPLTTITLNAPAKINLFLHIVGRRRDGYHLLQTVFQLLDFSDQLTLTANNSGQITLSPEIEDVPTQQNLIWQAADRLKQYLLKQDLLKQDLLKQDLSEQPLNTSHLKEDPKAVKARIEQLGAHITLDKKIPMGGGLGGGSSNAATTLVGLNHLWKCQLSKQQLAKIGTQLGADVPVFVAGNTAWAEGIGEILSPITIPPRWYLIIIPNCHVSTAKIFQNKELTRNTSPIRIAAFLEGAGRNDCEPLVRKLYPEVDSALTWLNQFSEAKLTGTGACVFAPFPNEEAAKVALQALPQEFNGFVAKGISHSPLQSLAT